MFLACQFPRPARADPWPLTPLPAVELSACSSAAVSEFSRFFARRIGAPRGECLCCLSQSICADGYSSRQVASENTTTLPSHSGRLCVYHNLVSATTLHFLASLFNHERIGWPRGHLRTLRQQVSLSHQ